MNFARLIQHERRLLSRHKDGYLCARLCALWMLCACVVSACLSLLMARELFFGPHPLMLARGLEGSQTALLLQHMILAVLAAGLGVLARALWRFDLRAWWLSLALTVPSLLAGPGAAYAHLFLLLAILLLCSHRTFRCSTP